MKVLLIGNISDTIILFRQHLIIKLIEKGNSVYTLTMDNNPDNFARIRKYGAIPKSYFFLVLELILLLILLIPINYQKKLKILNLI